MTDVLPNEVKAAAERTFSINRADYSGARLMIADAEVGIRLLNEARHRTLKWLFGIPREQSSLLTLIVLALVVENALEKSHRVMHAPAKLTLNDSALGVAAVREVLYDVAGPDARGTPMFTTLVAIGVFTGLLRQPAARSVRAARASSRRMRQSFGGRYGHVIGRSGVASKVVRVRQAGPAAPETAQPTPGSAHAR